MSAPITCKNCGKRVTENFCGHCGQKSSVGPLTIRGLWRELLDILFNLDRGLLPTLRDLLIRPGAMIREYLGGKRKSYIGPTRFLITTVALSYILYFGLLPDDFMQSGFGASPQPADEQSAKLMNWLNTVFSKYYTVVVLLLIPPYAVVYRVLFYRNELNLAGHLVVVTYASAFSALLPIPLVPFLLTGVMDPSVYLTTNTLISLVYINVVLILVLKPRNIVWALFKALLGNLITVLITLIVAFIAGYLLALSGYLK